MIFDATPGLPREDETCRPNSQNLPSFFIARISQYASGDE
jgi:hypothetical protein